MKRGVTIPEIALCPGSYDPVTFGHLNIIERAAGLFDKVIVAVMINEDKKCLFSIEERVEMLKATTTHIKNVEVTAFSGLVAEYSKIRGAKVMVKGLRAVTDFEYEFQMALINKKLNPDVETVFITADMKFMYLSSSAVRSVARYGGDLSDFVPKQVEKPILDRLYLKQD